MNNIICVDSLEFTFFGGLYRATEEERRNMEEPQFDVAFFSGDIPIHLSDNKNTITPKHLPLSKTTDQKW